jgi:hypothetical protein
MTNHEIVNKMAVIIAHLRKADTYCSNATSIDEIRAALSIAINVGDEIGKTLTKDSV